MDNIWNDRDNIVNVDYDNCRVNGEVPMMRRWRVRNAAKCGRIEHKFGRWIAFPIIAQMAFSYYQQDWYQFIIAIITFVFWFIYLTAHTIEKKLYGHFGPRG